jgi:hypothetical protein
VIIACVGMKNKKAEEQGGRSWSAAVEESDP